VRRKEIHTQFKNDLINWFRNRTSSTIVAFRSLLIVVCLIQITGELRSEVRIRPSAVYLSDNNQSGTISVINNGDESIDVILKMQYGHPTSDSSGRVSFSLTDTPEGYQAIDRSWIQVYPQQFLVKAHDWQVIRIKINPPSELKDGEYWLRPVLVVKSLSQNEKSKQVNSVASQQFVLLANYRRGSTYTGIVLERIMPILRPDGKLALKVDMLRQGNAAYRGSILCNIKDQTQKTVFTIKQNVAVYEKFCQNISLGANNLQDGLYTMDITASTKRDDNQGSQLLPAPDVCKQTSFSIYNNQFNTPGIVQAANLNLINTTPSPTDSPLKITETSDESVAQSTETADRSVKVKLLEQRLKELNTNLQKVLKELQAMK
jgi:hypothetical protein